MKQVFKDFGLGLSFISLVSIMLFLGLGMAMGPLLLAVYLKNSAYLGAYSIHAFLGIMLLGANIRFKEDWWRM